MSEPRDLVGYSQPMARGSVAWFLPLWFLWAGLLLGAMIVGRLGERHGAALPTAGRMGSSLVLVAVGWLAYSIWRQTSAGRYALLIALGMTLGTVGDFFNAGLLNFVPVLHGVLGGIAAFGLGHIAYIAGCVDLAGRAGLNQRRPLLVGILFWQVVGVVAWYFVVYLGSENRGLIWPALPYSLLLAGTAGITAGLAAQDRRLLGLALGGALFLASDLILAFGLFRSSFPYQTEAVWLTYGPGQMLIVYSTLSAAAVLSPRAH